MQGPELSLQEQAAALAGRVNHFVALGAGRTDAARMVAREHNLNPLVVVWALQEYATMTERGVI